VLQALKGVFRNKELVNKSKPISEYHYSPSLNREHIKPSTQHQRKGMSELPQKESNLTAQARLMVENTALLI
jgi:hypothetical protein